jgi:hypothetical protein
MAVLEDLRQPLRTPVDSHDIAESLEAPLSRDTRATSSESGESGTGVGSVNGQSRHFTAPAPPGIGSRHTMRSD